MIQIRSVILEGSRSLLESARALGYLSGMTDTSPEPLPSHQCRLSALCDMAKELPLMESEEPQEEEECVQPLVAEDGCSTHVDLFSRVTENMSEYATLVSLMGEEYVIPPHAAFLLSDFTRIQPLVQCECSAKPLVKQGCSFPD